MTRFPPADEVELGYYELSTHLLALEVLRRGHRIHWVHRSYFTTRIDGNGLGFWCTRTNAGSTVAAKAIERKDVARTILTAAGRSVARGESFPVRRADEAGAFASDLGYPLVVKPSDGTKGRGITVGVTSDAEFRRAWDVAVATGTRHVVVEQLFDGSDARFLVVGGRCIAVIQRIPANVVGDGVHTVEELLARKNEERKGFPHLRAHPLLMDPHRIDFIARSGYHLGSVLPDGHRLFLDLKANTSAGGDAVDLTDEVHPSFHEVVTAAVAAFPGLGLAGVDVLAKDLRRPATLDNHILLELNSMPRIVSHHFPTIGVPRDAARAIVDHVVAVAAGEHVTPPHPRHRRSDEVRPDASATAGTVSASGDATPYPPADQVELGYYEVSTQLLAREFLRRGHEVTWIHRSFFTTEVADRPLGVWSMRTNAASTVGAKSVLRKDIARRMLRRAGLSVAEGRTFRISAGEKARRSAARLGYPVVLEPTSGSKARGKAARVASDEAFARAWDRAVRGGAKLVDVRRHYPDAPTRFLVVGKRCVAVAALRPAEVVADGSSSLTELIEAANRDRARHPLLRLHPLSSTNRLRARLARAGHDLDGVLPAGVRLEFGATPRLSAGAVPVDLTDTVHPSYRDVAVAAVAAFPGLDLAGVEIVADDLTAPAGPDNHVVLDLQAMPQLAIHHFPAAGPGRDVAAAVVDQLTASPTTATRAERSGWLDRLRRRRARSGT
jgi:D-alanine-D-alanine ligase-like ATP-grasp enzyme